MGDVDVAVTVYGYAIPIRLTVKAPRLYASGGQLSVGFVAGASMSDVDESVTVYSYVPPSTRTVKVPRLYASGGQLAVGFVAGARMCDIDGRHVLSPLQQRYQCGG
jgi:hypothetical protein